MSTGKLIQFLSRPELAMSRLKKVLEKDIAKENRAFDLVPGVSDPIYLGKTKSGSGLEGVLELNPGSFNPASNSGRPSWYAYYVDPKNQKPGQTLSGLNLHDDMMPNHGTFKKAEKSPEAYEALMHLLDFNKKPSVFFADGEII